MIVPLLRLNPPSDKLGGLSFFSPVVWGRSEMVRSGCWEVSACFNTRGGNDASFSTIAGNDDDDDCDDGVEEGDSLLARGRGLVGSLMPLDLARSGMISARVGLIRSGRETPVTSADGVVTRERYVLPELGLENMN